MLKLEMDTSLKKILLENGLIKLYCLWSNMFTWNKTQTMLLVRTADYLRKYWKMWKMSFLKHKFIKKICHKQKFKCFGFFFFKSSRQVCNRLYFNSIKLHSKRLFSSKKWFSHFWTQNCEEIENSSKAPLSLSPLKCTYLGENTFQYHYLSQYVNWNKHPVPFPPSSGRINMNFSARA